MRLYGKIVFVSLWNDFCLIPLEKCISKGRATKRCKKFKFWHFWECPLYEIWEYDFKQIPVFQPKTTSENAYPNLIAYLPTKTADALVKDDNIILCNWKYWASITDDLSVEL